MSLFNQRIVSFTLALLLIGFAGSASANALQDIQQRGTITIGVHTTHAPYGFIDAQGKNSGFGIDLARYVALKLLGSEDAVKFVPVTPANRIPYLRKGRVDVVIATLSETEKRRRVIDYTDDYYASGASVLTPKDADIHSWDDLKGKKVCGLQGAFYNTQFSKMGLHMVNFDNTSAAYQALKENRCAGFAFDVTQLVGKLRQSWWKEHYHMATPAILVTPMGMGARKGNDALRKALNKVILQMEASGYIYALETKWDIPHTKFVVEHMDKARQKLQSEQPKAVSDQS